MNKTASKISEAEIPAEIMNWLNESVKNIFDKEYPNTQYPLDGYKKPIVKIMTEVAQAMYWKLIEESPSAYWFEKARENLVERNEAKGGLLKLKYALQAILAKDKSFDGLSSGNQDMEHEGRLAGIKKDLEGLLKTL